MRRKLSPAPSSSAHDRQSPLHPLSCLPMLCRAHSPTPSLLLQLMMVVNGCRMTPRIGHWIRRVVRSGRGQGRRCPRTRPIVHPLHWVPIHARISSRHPAHRISSGRGRSGPHPPIFRIKLLRSGESVLRRERHVWVVVRRGVASGAHSATPLFLDGAERCPSSSISCRCDCIRREDVV